MCKVRAIASEFQAFPPKPNIVGPPSALPSIGGTRTPARLSFRLTPRVLIDGRIRTGLLAGVVFLAATLPLASGADNASMTTRKPKPSSTPDDRAAELQGQQRWHASPDLRFWVARVRPRPRRDPGAMTCCRRSCWSTSLVNENEFRRIEVELPREPFPTPTLHSARCCSSACAVVLASAPSQRTPLSDSPAISA